jgi:hypothetical protein
MVLASEKEFLDVLEQRKQNGKNLRPQGETANGGFSASGTEAVILCQGFFLA